MKKILKIIRNYIGKNLLNLLIKLKRFDAFPSFVKLFPKSKYKAIQSLMHRGYLDLAYKIAKDHTPKEHEELLVQRVLSMYDVKENGFQTPLLQNSTISGIKPLFVVHNSLPYEHAGYAIRTHTIVKYLYKQGMNVDVVTRAGYPWDLIKHRDKPYKETDIIDGIVYKRLKDTNKTFKKGSDSNYISVYAQALVDEIVKNNYTLLHASSNYLNALAAIKAASKTNIPVIYEMRGLWYITRTTLDSKFKTSGMYEYEHQMELAAVKGANKVVVISQALKKLLKEWKIPQEKITVIPNAVDIEIFQPLPKDVELLNRYNLKDKFVIGFIGSLTGYEGLKELVLSVESLVKDGLKDIVLMIVGEGREKKNLESLVKSKNIIFTGRVPFEEVSKYYSIFDICPFPRNDYEVCRYVPPLKPLEAMAMQKAVIVSDVAPLLEMVEVNKTALVCKADSVDSLKEKILELYKDRQKVIDLGKNARTWVKINRNWYNIAKKYKELYEFLD